jgi:putative DNA methylase
LTAGGSNSRSNSQERLSLSCVAELKLISTRVTAVVILKIHEVAAMVQNALLFHDQTKYRLAGWVVMPNHVHVLCTPCAGYGLAQVMHSIKSFTANEANKMLERRGRFWQKEYFDRYIRNARHFSKVVAYIENNPVKANLCEKATDWPFSSARYRKT